jgi:hypothetical protein
MNFTVTVDASLSLTTWLMIVVLIVGTGMLIALAVAFRRRTPGLAVPPVASRNTADALASRIAALDDAFAAGTRGGETEETYRKERAALKRQLAALLERDTKSR